MDLPWRRTYILLVDWVLWLVWEGSFRWREGGKIGLKKRMLGEIARIEGHLRVGMETSGNFLKYMKVILMKCTNSEGDQVPGGHLCHQMNLDWVISS